MLSTDKPERKGYESPECKLFSIMIEHNFCSVDASEVVVDDYVYEDEDLD